MILRKFRTILSFYFPDVKTVLFFIAVSFLAKESYAQPCTTLGQTPSTAFPVCGTTVFRQNTVPICATNPLYVPGCSTQPGAANYENKNPFFYKFTCFAAGTLGFVITPLAANEDYDWQLWDITGKNPDDIFTDNTLVVAGNWAGTYGATGASATGVNGIECASVPTDNKPTFAKMPVLILGHEYLLLVSHYTDGQSGYDLSFGGGTAVITDPLEPHLKSIKPDCDGQTLTVKLNKKMRCNTLTSPGTEFSLVPNVATVVSATTTACTSGFDFDEITLRLSTPLPNGTYDLIINNGSDNNTLLDVCQRAIPQGEVVSFYYAIPRPILADSVGTTKCAPDSVRVYFPKKIACNTVAANGSDFSVSGPTAVTVVSAGGNCINNKADIITVKFASPIYTRGNYLLTLKAGDDGTVIIDECGQEMPLQTLPFSTVDTVNAGFSVSNSMACRVDTLTFSHNGAHNVNSWNWTFDGTAVNTQSHTVTWPAVSNHTVSLIVSNGVCSDTASQEITLDHEVKADFSMPSILCPEDMLELQNNSTGLIDNWRWHYDVIGGSNVKDPPPFQFPFINREAYYTVKLVVSNNAINCADSMRKTLTVLDLCLIEVPTGFTPNNDGLNDYFRPHNAIKADNYEFKVYNRWGQLVFQSKNWQDKWDGRYNGELQGTGVFVWTLSYVHRDTKQQVTRKGTVTLIR